MSRIKCLLLGMTLGCVSSAALAFQETKGNVSGEPRAAVTPSDLPKTQLDLRDTGTSIAPSNGTEVRIPGLGKLGVLPKLDFGLELLYGVNEQKPIEPERGRLDQPDDLQIRGSLKHRF